MKETLLSVRAPEWRRKYKTLACVVPCEDGDWGARGGGQIPPRQARLAYIYYIMVYEESK